MSKRKLEWNEAKYKRFLKEGRGQGQGVSYKPWLMVQDVPSIGRSSRAPGWKTNRLHHFFSDLETSCFYLLEWSDRVKDIREQFPLLDLKKAMEIAQRIGIKYPIDNSSDFPHVLTTDFLITVSDGNKEFYFARTVKPFGELEKKRVRDKFDIERIYWEEQNVDWGIVTDRDISKEFVRNIEWVHTAYRLESTPEYSLEYLTSLTSILRNQLLSAKSGTIQSICSGFDQEMNLTHGIAVYLLRHLIATKSISFDMKIPINTGMPISSILKTDLSVRVGGIEA